MVVVSPLVRVRSGETGEPRSSSRKSGLLASQLKGSCKERLSNPNSVMLLLFLSECDILFFQSIVPVTKQQNEH